MECINTQVRYYYVTLKGCHGTQWLADERIKKQFLNQLLKIRNKLKFHMYAFCVLDREAHFLMSIPESSDIDLVSGEISRELEKCYLAQYPEGKERVKAASKYLSVCSAVTMLEYCCRIHLLTNAYAGKIQDYWWSSYLEYLKKNITGLVETEKVLSALDADPCRAVRKFVSYHKQGASIINNASKGEKGIDTLGRV